MVLLSAFPTVSTGLHVNWTCGRPSKHTPIRTKELVSAWTPANHGLLELISRLRGEAKRFSCTSIICKAKTSRGAEDGDGWIAENDAVARSTPLILGSVALVAVLLNRSLSGIAPVADASSAQSRADVLAVALAATVLLQGLVWKSIQPKPVISVEMEGVECFNMAQSLPDAAARDLQWVWEALRGTTRSQALVVVYGNACALQAGLAAESEDGGAVPVDATALLHGALCQSVRKSGKQNYLANLALYPGRFELPFLPCNTQAVIIQALGDDGVLIVGNDTIRGFTSRDQAWIGTIGEKLDNSLGEWAAFNVSTTQANTSL